MARQSPKPKRREPRNVAGGQSPLRIPAGTHERLYAALTDSTPAGPPKLPPIAGIYRNLPVRFPSLWSDQTRIAWTGSASAKIEAQAPPLARLPAELWEGFYAAQLRYFREQDPSGAEAFENAIC